MEFTWEIDGLETTKLVDDKDNVVSKIHWRILASDTIDDIYYIESLYGVVEIKYDADSVFTSYASLSKNQILEWVWKDVNKEELESNIQIKLNKKINQEVGVLPLPWLEGAA